MPTLSPLPRLLLSFAILKWNFFSGFFRSWAAGSASALCRVGGLFVGSWYLIHTLEGASLSRAFYDFTGALMPVSLPQSVFQVSDKAYSVRFYAPKAARISPRPELVSLLRKVVKKHAVARTGRQQLQSFNCRTNNRKQRRLEAPN